MALTKAHIIKGIELPNCYAVIYQHATVWLPNPKTLNVHVALFGDKAAFDAGEKPFEVHSKSVKAAQAPAALKQAAQAYRTAMYGWLKGLIENEDDPDAEEWDWSGATDDGND